MSTPENDSVRQLRSADERLRVDLDLLKKYNVAGPRYTSYPTALQFDDAMEADEVEGRLLEERASSRPLSLYFHLPFCRSLCWYCACTKIITRDRSKSAAYLDLVEAELDRRREVTDGRSVVQVHYGGGTPTFLSPGELQRLGEGIQRRFDVADDAEMSVEIDPREFDRDKAFALAEGGFNRASIGIQDTDKRVQEAINRHQPMELNKKAVDWLDEAGIDALNVDLIYGLPHQTLASFEATLDDVLELEPDRFAIYSYAHVPWVNPAQKHLERTGLPSPDEKLRLLKLAIERLDEEGYVYIGMDHFAKPDDELAVALEAGELQRNFQGYSTRGGADIMAYGMSAISQSRDMYFQNHKDLDGYREAIGEGRWPLYRGVVLDEDDLIRRHTIMQIMCRARLDFEKLSEEFGVDFERYFAAELARLSELEDDHLVRRQRDHLQITPTGRLFLRNIAMAFDRYLQERRAEGGYSKTI
ncbi:MAG: oxygen-independent coproporphyrinogen III oxidase [Persicimonas sp.]